MVWALPNKVKAIREDRLRFYEKEEIFLPECLWTRATNHINLESSADGPIGQILNLLDSQLCE